VGEKFKKFIIKKLGLFWIIGILLLITVTVALGILIPIKNNKINILKDELNNLQQQRDVRIFQNHQDYLHYTLKDKVIRLTYLNAENMKMSEENKSKIYDEYREAIELGLGKLYIMHTGKIAPMEVSNDWKKMDIDQLSEEQNKMENNSNLQELLDEINGKKDKLARLETNKTNFIVWITVFQVLGLVLINTSEFLKKN